MRNDDGTKKIAEWPLVERLAFLLKVNDQPPELRVAFITKNGFTVEQIERWRTDARKQLRHLPSLKQRRDKAT